MKRREPAIRRIKKHPAVAAWDAFKKKNADLFDIPTIGGDTPLYLHNRLQHAFMDGWDEALKVGEKTALDVVEEAVSRSTSSAGEKP